jgi:hypothetical protein
MNRKRVRCWRFGAVARRAEGEYPSWIFDRRATPPQLQKIHQPSGLSSGGPLAALLLSHRTRSYAPSSRLPSSPPGLSALISYF